MQTILTVNENLNNLKRIENIQPNDYKIIGMFWKEQVDENEWEIEFNLDGSYDETAFSKTSMFANIIAMMHAKKSRCNHCNKYIQYVMLGLNNDGTLNLFGHKCTENITMYQGISFDTIQKRSLNSMVRFKNQEKRTKFLSNHEGLEDALKSTNKIVVSINETFVKYMKLSEKQIALVLKLSEQQKKFDVDNAKKDALALDVPETKVVCEEFKIISLKKINLEFDNQYIYKSVIENVSSLYKVYGNISVAVVEEEGKTISVGDVITATATLVRSKDNPKFGFFKRIKITK